MILWTEGAETKVRTAHSDSTFQSTESLRSSRKLARCGPSCNQTRICGIVSHLVQQTCLKIMV